MKTQSIDTSLDAERVLIEMIRRAPLPKRFAFVQSWTVSMMEAGRQYVQQLHPQASDEEVQLLFVERQYGKDLTDELRMALHTQELQVDAIPDFSAAISQLVEAFDALHVSYALGGSLASSLYGMQRATLQIDFVAELRNEHVPVLFDALQKVYLHLRDEGGDGAVEQRTHFTLVHLLSLLKVVVSLPEPQVGEQSVLQRARQIKLDEAHRPIAVLSPEDILLPLLVAFKRSRERADDLWYDALGILKVQGVALDIPFLEHQAAVLNVAELLARALVDAGLREA
ncbi:MAG: hypothetical protein NVSMB27_45830 [Ktedonobacteraceae bacterium]